jgi:carboxymethylenebutenolidase
MTGGVGHNQLKRFYKYHFIGANPPDTAMKLTSRTVGENSLVDEMLFPFAHTSEIDWMLPGIAPTGRRVEIPLVAIVQFSGDKLVHGPGTDRSVGSEGPATGWHRDGAQGDG